jgi:hypothetical protein
MVTAFPNTPLEGDPGADLHLTGRLRAEDAPEVRRERGYAFVPDRVTTLLRAEAFPPNSGGYIVFWILNSWIASGDG